MMRSANGYKRIAVFFKKGNAETEAIFKYKVVLFKKGAACRVALGQGSNKKSFCSAVFLRHLCPTSPTVISKCLGEQCYLKLCS